jgi:hypothetical protein
MRSRNNALEFSTAGSDVLEAGDAVTGKRYGALQFIKDSTLTALTASNVNNTSINKLLNVGIGAGTVLYGDFSAVTLSSTGTSLVVAHKY